MNDLLKAYLSRSALCHNVRLIMDRTGNTPVCAMVKANAYGHNIALVSRVFSGIGISFWGVASLQEAAELRQLNMDEPVLVVRPFGLYESENALKEEIEFMANSALRPTVVSEQGLDLLARHTAMIRKKVYVHIKVDTGMGRNGCLQEQAVSLVAKVDHAPYLQLEGIYSHFASAGGPDLGSAREQLRVFHHVLKNVESGGINIPIKHMANSSAIFNIPESWFDIVRPGVALYGYRDASLNTSEQLIPTLRLDAPVIMTKRIRKGSACGYGGTFVAKRDTRIGLLPLGYYDGYSRQWSDKGVVAFNDKLAPVIGRVSMDLTIIDLTDIPECAVGSHICVISNQRGAPNSVECMAKQLGTIPHEITCRLGQRVQWELVD